MIDNNLPINSSRKGFLTTKNISILFGILVVFLISYYLITQIFEAFKASDRLTEAVDNVHSLEVKNKELKNQLEEVASLDFIEREARDKLGLVKEGEIVVVIPDEKINKILGLEVKMDEIKLPNWQGWLRLFFE